MRTINLKYVFCVIALLILTSCKSKECRKVYAPGEALRLNCEDES